MKKKDTTSDGASEWGSASPERITPSDVQEKEFRVARFGAGYRMREVDEFLDQVTDALSALTAENERLLRGAGDRLPASTAPPSTRPTVDEDDRAAVDAFIKREKGFLQDLGGLVQSHAEELRSMVRAARRDAAAPATEVSPADEPRVEHVLSTAVVSETEPEAPPRVPEEAPEEAGAPPDGDSSLPDTIEVAQVPAPAVAEDDHPDHPEDAEEPPPTVTGFIADEPIRLEEPEPARSRRSDEEQDGSLRELFWGEGEE